MSLESITQQVKAEISKLTQVLRARRYWYKENSAGKGTPTQDISRRQEKNSSGTAGTVGKNQGSKEGVVRHFEISGRTVSVLATASLGLAVRC
jgi:hypothetical protein